MLVRSIKFGEEFRIGDAVVRVEKDAARGLKLYVDAPRSVPAHPLKRENAVRESVKRLFR